MAANGPGMPFSATEEAFGVRTNTTVMPRLVAYGANALGAIGEMPWYVLILLTDCATRMTYNFTSNAPVAGSKMLHDLLFGIEIAPTKCAPKSKLLLVNSPLR